MSKELVSILSYRLDANDNGRWTGCGRRVPMSRWGVVVYTRVSTYLLIPGAGGVAWYWHRLAPLLDRAIAVDLPGDDPSQGLPEYVDLVVEAAAGETDLVVVAQSLGAFTALPACARLDVRHLFLLNAMIPAPGETAGEWWENTGSGEARVAAARAGGYDEAFDVDTYFLHDVDPGDPRHRRGAPRGRRRVRDAVRLHGVAADDRARGCRGPLLPAGVPAPRGARAARARCGGGAGRAPRGAQPARGRRACPGSNPVSPALASSASSRRCGVRRHVSGTGEHGRDDGGRRAHARADPQRRHVAVLGRLQRARGGCGRRGSSPSARSRSRSRRPGSPGRSRARCRPPRRAPRARSTRESPRTSARSRRRARPSRRTPATARCARGRRTRPRR